MDAANNAPNRLDPATIERLLDLLAEPSTTVAEAEQIMARFDGREVEAVLPVFRRLHDAGDQPTLHAAARLLSRWSGRPVARALVPALEALLEEPGVGDLNKLAAAGVLETLGQPVDYPTLLRRLEDLGGVARAALDAALAVADHPVALVNFVDQLGRMPRAQVLAVVDDIPPGSADAARPILVALAHSADADIAVSAIAAIDRLCLRDAAGALARIAVDHADPLLREQALQTLARLGAIPRRSGPGEGPEGGPEGSSRASGGAPFNRRKPANGGTHTNGGVPANGGTGPVFPGAAASPPPPPSGIPASGAPAIPTAIPATPVGATAYRSSRNTDGGMLLLLAIPSHAGHGWLDVLTVYATKEAGVRDHGTAEGVAPVRFEAMLAECAAGGVPLEPVEWPAVLVDLKVAVVRALQDGGLPQVGPVAWLAAMETQQ